MTDKKFTAYQGVLSHMSARLAFDSRIPIFQGIYLKRPGLPRRVNRELRAAFTLVEILVVILIIGVLLSLLAVAINGARERARGVTCQNHLKQLALAVQNYESVHQQLPVGNAKGWSFHYQILTQLDNPTLWESLQAEGGKDPDYCLKVKESIPIFLCPSDGATSLPLAATNYAGNAGVWPLTTGFNGAFVIPQAIDIYNNSPVRVTSGMISDGLSNTSLVSEVIHADGGFAPERTNWDTVRKYFHINDFAHACQSVLGSNQHSVEGDRFARGYPWSAGDVGYTLYTHVTPPNSVSCNHNTVVLEAAIAPSSYHPGIVHTVFMDGSNRPVADQVDIQVFRSFGSRNSLDR
jgi:prepilin-type N-terminal cleavage/methylation domain-containing protein